MSVSIDRRRMLALGAVAAGAAAPALAEQTAPSKAAATKLSLEIGPVSVELAPGVVIQTTGYNGTAPGPVLRLREGQPVEIAVRNRTAAPNLVHWHGLHNPPVQDGAVEEGSLAIAPGGELTYRFTPRPAGTHWYHTHVMAMTDLTRGGYNGEFGFLLVEPTRESGPLRPRGPAGGAPLESKAVRARPSSRSLRHAQLRARLAQRPQAGGG
jgi:FtsP/CotA-like multicopper oxidase with cupredoxin domain